MRKKDDNKQHAICQSAKDLINSIGFAETSMSKIAKKAKVSPATIYVYFKNKEDLLNQLYLNVKRELWDGMLDGFSKDMPVELGFKLVLRNTFHYSINHPDNFTFYEQFANSPLINRVNIEKAHSYYQPVFDLLARGKREKILRDLPDEILISFAFHPMVQLAKGHVSGEFVLDSQMLESVLELAWDGVTV